MLKRWGISLAALAISASAAPAAIAGTGAVAETGAPAASAGITTSTGTVSGGTRAVRYAPVSHRPVSPTPGTPEVAAYGRTAAGQATSANWSGYAASGATYKSVSATWKQPPVTCGSGSQYSSFWVGLDGYSSQTVEQIGTDSDCSGGAHYYGWYEMYPSPSHDFSHAVSPGDIMHASVTYAGNGSYRLALSNESRKWNASVTKSLPGATRHSAEVIIEAPSDSSGILPLAHFGPTPVSDARIDGRAIGGYSPTRIIMANGGGTAKDAVSPLSNGENFRVTWRHAG